MNDVQSVRNLKAMISHSLKCASQPKLSMHLQQLFCRFMANIFFYIFFLSLQFNLTFLQTYQHYNVYRMRINSLQWDEFIFTRVMLGKKWIPNGYEGVGRKKKAFFTIIIIMKHWRRLLAEAVQSPLWKVFKPWVEEVLSNLI